MRALPNRLGLPRYGITVSKRVGNAVTRNRVKRIIREILRLTPLPAGWDIVFIARSTAATTAYDILKKSVTGLLYQAQLLARGNEEGCLRFN